MRVECGKKLGPLACCTEVEQDCVTLLGSILDKANLVITSLPPLSRAPYSEWLGEWQEYMSLLWMQCHRTMKDGGYIVVIFPLRCEMWGETCLPMGADIIKQLQGQFDLRRHLVVAEPGGKHFFQVVVGEKWLKKKQRPPPRYRWPGAEMTKEETEDWEADMWMFPDGVIGSFPEEAVERLIKLYSFKGDLVVDPFTSDGGRLLQAASDMGRHFWGATAGPGIRKCQ